MFHRRFVSTGILASLAGCASLTFDQIPGPKQELRVEVPRTAQRLCDSLPAAAASLQLTVGRWSADLPTPPSVGSGNGDVLKPLAGGCLAELAREAPWWMPGDDGVRMRVRVAPAAGDDASKAIVEMEVKRVAAGQLWIAADGQPFLRRLQDMAAGGR